MTMRVLACSECDRDSTPVDIDEEDMEEADVWDAMEKAFPSWFFPREKSGARLAVCPTCVVRKRDLPSYSVRPRCSKCGCNKIETKYRTDEERAMYGPVEWMSRRCKRCGYHWEERTRDSVGPDARRPPAGEIGSERQDSRAAVRDQSPHQ